MKVYAFGKPDAPAILLLPGTCCDWKGNFEAVIPLLEKQYHVIAVSTDGYDDTGKTTFTTAEAMAEKLEDLYEDCDVSLKKGGQPLYYYLISVE